MEVLPRWTGVRHPRLLGVDATTRTLRLSVLAGRPGSFDDPPEVFAQAGAALRRLHCLPCPAAPGEIPLDEALALRCRSTPAIHALVARHADRLRVPRVWCHRDYQPQNWMVDESGLGVLDFEHVRPDHPLVDWARLEARGWRPEQRAAFAAAYGAVDPVALRCVVAVYGAATVAWATAHDDPDLIRIGERALAWRMDGHFSERSG